MKLTDLFIKKIEKILVETEKCIPQCETDLGTVVLSEIKKSLEVAIKRIQKANKESSKIKIFANFINKIEFINDQLTHKGYLAVFKGDLTNDYILLQKFMCLTVINTLLSDYH